MEMSVGTMVTIVLLVIVLVLGIFFIQRIFTSGTNAIDGIDTKIQTEIDNLFAQEGKKIVVYPKEREITMDQGDSGGFGFSIENKDLTDGTFTYQVLVEEIASGCQLTNEQAESLIILGKSGTKELGSGAKLDDAIFVKFSIPETAPICAIRYSIDVEKDGDAYTSSSMDLKIK
jgi:hypothetical protein